MQSSERTCRPAFDGGALHVTPEHSGASRNTLLAARKRHSARAAREPVPSREAGFTVARSASNKWGCMANVIVVGGGPTGLTAAVKFGGAGATVTVLERDPAPMPDSPTDAWERWERPAVPQFRQIHYLQPGGRWALEAHLPSVIDDLRGVGAIELHPDVIFCAPDPVPDPCPACRSQPTDIRR